LGREAGCVVAMEASSSAHHWARKLIALGLDARIMSAQLVSLFSVSATPSVTRHASNRNSALR
jgi:transposase